MPHPPIRILNMRSAFLLLSCAAVLAAGCSRDATPAPDAKPTKTADAVKTSRSHDESSYSEPGKVVISDLALDLALDFDKKEISGTAIYKLDWKDKSATQLVLDTRALTISKVEGDDGKGNWTPLKYALAANDKIYGSKLTIETPARNTNVQVTYNTSPEASGLQWLEPSMTEGKQLPFMFSQSQAIHARSWVPLQDTPSVRFTYTAHVTSRPDVMVLMSADNDPAAKRTGDYTFSMPNPIPSYLLAIAAGDLVFKPISARSGVWAEPAMVDKAAKEFEDTEKMIQTAESLYGPYRWGRYDILVLPPSFPFGGMENPTLTFATPTVIVGDRSLVSLVAHELAHSWSGNLVTNATWSDIWLNEGTTTYFENRIMEALYGRERALQEQALGWNDLIAEIAVTAPDDTRLHLDLTGRDPDDGLSGIPYDKGAAFLRTIERIVGRETFDAWLRGYFDRHAFQPMTDVGFLADIREHLVKGDAALEAELQLDEWIYQPGMPSNAQAPVSHAFEAVDAQAKAFFADEGPASAIDWKNWNTQQRQRFLAWRPEGLKAGADWLTTAQLADLEKTLNLADEGNAELTFAWLQIALAHRYEPAVAVADRFLTSQGRRKFVLPLFQTLWNEGDWGRPIATRIYAQARPLYHPVTSRSVDQLVGQS